MKRNLLFGRILALIFLVIFLASPQAGTAQKSYAVGIGGGASIPVGKFSDAVSTGYNGTFFVAIGLPELPIGVRFDGVYDKFLRKDDAVTGGASATTQNRRVIGVVANLIYTFPGTTAKPYIIAGGGIYNMKAQSDTKSENDFGFNAGVGATFALGGLGTFLESRYHSISRDAASGGNVQFVPITFGFVF